MIATVNLRQLVATLTIPIVPMVTVTVVITGVTAKVTTVGISNATVTMRVAVTIPAVGTRTIKVATRTTGEEVNNRVDKELVLVTSLRKNGVT